VIYHMVAGRLPFVTESKGTEQLMAYMNAHLKLEPIPLQQLVPGACPDSLGQFVMRLLAKNPAHRPADAAEALAELSGIRDNAELAETTQPISAADIAEGLDSETLSMVLQGPAGESGPVSITGESVSGSTSDTLGTQADDMPNGTMAGKRGPARGLAFAVAAVLVAGISFFVTQGDESVPKPGPAAVQAVAETEAERAAKVQAAAAEAVAKALEANAAPGKILIHSAPTGATCTSETGEALGTTPLTLGADRIAKVGVVVLSLDGHREARTEKLAPPKANETRDVKITLTALPRVTFASTPAGATVHLDGASQAIGTTPFDWAMPAEVADRVESGKPAKFSFIKPGLRTASHTLGASDIKSGRAVVATALYPKVQRAPSPARARSQSRPATRKAPASKPKPKPKKKSGAKWEF
jgi:hypothetical protein